MIQHGVFIHEGPPLLVANQRSFLPCGCFVIVGLRMDTREAATGGYPCGPHHRCLLERFRLALTDSLVNPTSRPLIDVVDEMLTAEGVRR